MSYVHVFSYGKMMTIYVAWILTEASTPFLNGVWFFGKMERKGLRAASGALLWLVYLPTRILYSPLTAYAIVQNWPTFAMMPPGLTGCLLVMLVFATIMNYFWFYKISLGLLKALGKLSKEA